METYDGDDDASMADNNTSAFNDRTIKGSASQSLHAYGLAIDLNPLQNPFVARGGKTAQVEPTAGGEYLDRSNPRNGMAESVIEIFADHGFLIWGGGWRNPIDYQHFQVDRRLAKEVSADPPGRAQTLFDSYVERYRACRQAAAQQNSGDRCRRGVRP
jgi:D-alanyl-D-alanine carboxypeptidase